MNGVNENSFDGILIQRGIINVDRLKSDKKVVDFVRDYFFYGKPLLAICHSPSLLLETAMIKKKTDFQLFS